MHTEFTLSAEGVDRLRELSQRVYDADKIWKFELRKKDFDLPEPDQEAHNKQKRIKTLTGYIDNEDYADFADRDKWIQEKADLESSLDESSTHDIITKRIAIIKSQLEDRGARDVAFGDICDDWDNSHEYTSVTLCLMKGSSKLASYSDDMQITGFDFSTLSQDEQTEFVTLATETLSSAFSYLKGLGIGSHVNEFLEDQFQPDGFINQIKAEKTGHNLFTHFYKNRSVEKHIPFVRAVLAANAYWNGDERAKRYLHALEYVLTPIRELSGGMSGPCSEQDYVAYLDTLSNNVLVHNNDVKMMYKAQIMSPDNPQLTKEIEASRLAILNQEKKPKALPHIITEEQRDEICNDFSKQIAIWQRQYTRLKNKEEQLQQQIKDDLEGRVCNVEESIRTVVDYDDVSRDPTNYGSCVELQIWATPTDIAQVKQLPLLKGVWIRPESIHWSFIYAVNGQKSRRIDLGNIPGVKQMRSKGLHI